MADQGMKFVIDVVNSEKMVELTAEMGKQKMAVIALNDQLKAGTLNQQQFNAAAAPIGAQMKLINQQFRELQASAGSAGRGLGQLAYAIDDVQYGFNAIVNNIPQIVMGLGGGMGLAGAIGIAAVAINQLIKHWTDLTSALQAWNSGETASGIKHIAEQAEAAGKAFDKLAEAKTKAQGKEVEAVGTAITEGPTQRVMAALLVAIQGDPLAAKREKAEAFASGAMTMGGVPHMGKSQPELDAEARRKDFGIIKGLMGQAQQPGPEGDRARMELARLAKKAPEGALPQGFISDIENATPEGQDRQKHFEKMADARKKIEADIETKRKEHAQKAEHQGQVEAKLAKEIFDEKKKERIEALQDQEKLIMRQKHQIAENLWQAEHLQRPGQILQGAKAALDLFQTAGGGTRELQMKAHRLQEEANKKLDKIKDAITAQQRAGVILAK